jgi:phosphocarrier protein HPr
MSHDSRAVRRQVEIVNALGLHLRPASKFVQTADRFQAEIRVLYKGQTFDGRSILDLATLAAERGSRLELEATGEDAEEALDALAELIAAEFFEDANGDDLPPGGALPHANHNAAPEAPPPAAEPRP